jgi:hypothetical protein
VLVVFKLLYCKELGSEVQLHVLSIVFTSVTATQVDIIQYVQTDWPSFYIQYSTLLLLSPLDYRMSENAEIEPMNW